MKLINLTFLRLHIHSRLTWDAHIKKVSTKIIRRGKWGKVITRGKLIFRFAGINQQMTPNDKEEKLILLLVRNF